MRASPFVLCLCLVLNDKDVIVIGFAAVGFEHSAIYIHREDAEAGIMSNGLWLELPNDFSHGELDKGGGPCSGAGKI